MSDSSILAICVASMVSFVGFCVALVAIFGHVDLS